MIKIQDVIRYLSENSIKYSYEGSNDFSFATFCPLNQLKEDSITWVRDVNKLNVEELNAVNGILLFSELNSKISGATFPVLYVENVHRSFFRIISFFFDNINPDKREPKIEKTAIVESHSVGKNVYIGHHTFIGKEVEIGDNVMILNNVTIQGRVIIGDHTIIESGSTIGACGFGQYWDENNNPVTVVHMGGVIIGHHVKIGANNAISRGCLADTIIEDYVQTDNLCHIAHNDIVKRGAILTANTVISGSTTIGENVWLAPGSLISNSVNVGKDAFLGIGAVAIKDVPENMVVAGVPAKTLRERY